jgi:hypothetical protein
MLKLEIKLICYTCLRPVIEKDISYLSILSYSVFLVSSVSKKQQTIIGCISLLGIDIPLCSSDFIAARYDLVHASGWQWRYSQIELHSVWRGLLLCYVCIQWRSVILNCRTEWSVHGACAKHIILTFLCT